MISPASFCGRRVDRQHLGLGAALADAAGLDADVGGGVGLERLLLRPHDRLQARIAGLVDRVADRDHRGQLDLDRVVAVLRLALADELAVADVDLDHLGQRRHLQVVGDHGADRVALAVVGLLAEQHQIGLLGLERLGERVAGRADVRAGQRLRRSGGPSGRRPSATALCRARTADSGPMVTATISSTSTAALSDLHRRLDAVGVEGVEVLLARAVEPHRRGVDPLLHGGVRNLFHETADLQVRPSFGALSGKRAAGNLIDRPR